MSFLLSALLILPIKWLHPYMGLLDELENAKGEREANQVFLTLEQSFELFHQKFQSM